MHRCVVVAVTLLFASLPIIQCPDQWRIKERRNTERRNKPIPSLGDSLNEQGRIGGVSQRKPQLAPGGIESVLKPDVTSQTSTAMAAPRKLASLLTLTVTSMEQLASAEIPQPMARCLRSLRTEAEAGTKPCSTNSPEERTEPVLWPL